MASASDQSGPLTDLAHEASAAAARSPTGSRTANPATSSKR